MAISGNLPGLPFNQPTIPNLGAGTTTGLGGSTNALVSALEQLLLPYLEMSQTHQGGLTALGTSQETTTGQPTTQPGALAISAGTDAKTVQSYLAQNPNQAKVAITKDGSAYLVYGTSTSASGQTMVETSALDSATGGTDWEPLSQFDKSVSYLDPGQGAKAKPLTPITGSGAAPLQGGINGNQTYTLNAFYKDPQSGQPMVSLKDGNGRNVNLTTQQFGNDFGFPQIQSLVHDSLTPAAQSAYTPVPFGGASGDDGFSVGFNTTPDDVAKWLGQGGFPKLANTYSGSTYVVDGIHTDSNGQQYLTVENPNGQGGTSQVSLSSALATTHYFDNATGGVGSTKFSALTSGNGVQAGQQYTYQGMSVSASGKAQVDLTDANHMPVSIPLSQFGSTVGQKALKNLTDSSRADISVESNAASGASYSTLTNTELFAASTDPYDIQQSDNEGDCYLTSTMMSLERQNPDALKNMIRPSADGNPDNYDVRFYAPQRDGSFKPVWITVNDQLASLSNNTLAGNKGVIDPATGKTQIGYALIEKAYAQFNQEYGTNSQNGGYDGVAGGEPDHSLEYFTGQPQTLQWTQSTSTSDLFQILSQANDGTPLVAGTKQPNGPGEDQIAANLYYGHAYSVIGTSTDPTTHQQMVTLRNPWGVNTDADGKKVDGNGTFTIPLSVYQQYFMYVSDPTANGGSSSGS